MSGKYNGAQMLEILYPLTVRTLVKQPDVRHRAHGRERAMCVWDRASVSAKNFVVKLVKSIKQNIT